MKRFNHLKIKELKSLIEKIQVEITRIENNTSAKEGLAAFKEDSQSEADMALNDYSSAQMLRFQNRELFYLKKLRLAHEKFDSEEYGACEDCGDEIKFARLFARPTAELCINCKEEAESLEKNKLPGNTRSRYNENVSLA